MGLFVRGNRAESGGSHTRQMVSGRRSDEATAERMDRQQRPQDSRAAAQGAPGLERDHPPPGPARGISYSVSYNDDVSRRSHGADA